MATKAQSIVCAAQSDGKRDREKERDRQHSKRKRNNNGSNNGRVSLPVLPGLELGGGVCAINNAKETKKRSLSHFIISVLFC